MQSRYRMEESQEQAGYLEFAGAHLYTVLHKVADPVARVLLVGPFAAERHFSYIPWVRWARFLAARQIETLRYDYRGVGESTGDFEDISYDHWNEDVKFLAGWLKRRSPAAPLILHGLELGALLASKAFEAGEGNALLMWSPPMDANEVLRKALLRRIAVDHTFNMHEHKSLEDYIRQLETGQPLEVEGYKWSTRLWRESLGPEMQLGLDAPASVVGHHGRPIKVVKLARSAAPLVKGSSLGYIVSLNPDLRVLFSENADWILGTLPVPLGDRR
jgi:hypothetical protein